MAKALQRILRIRQLAEEQARLNVERAAQRARQASAACARQVELEREQRSTLAASWIFRQQVEPARFGRAIGPAHAAEEKGWLMEEAVLEFLGWTRKRLEELRQAELRHMEPLIEEYTERRRELRQTEQLVEQHAGEQAVEKNRRAQAETDEWFSQQRLIRQRRELRRTQANRAEDSVGGARLVKPEESADRQF
jgi:flagellar biosynthesis chaperone FliJ